jgi:hypothetical protein
MITAEEQIIEEDHKEEYNAGWNKIFISPA